MYDDHFGNADFESKRILWKVTLHIYLVFRMGTRFIPRHQRFQW